MPSALPHQRLQRALGLARFDALSLVLIAAPAAVVSLVAGDRLGAAVGAGVTLCGVAEWHGRALLLRRHVSGITWLCVSQLFCLSLILVYASNLAQQPRAQHIVALLPAFTREQLAALFADEDAVTLLLVTVQRLIAAVLAFSALVYQGGLAFYYLRTAPMARETFAEPPVLVPEPPVGSP